ncbi:MAG: RNA polymerase sigma factor [Crocinitomicaceae bacterium]
MKANHKNNHQFNSFFKQEYRSLKAFVKSRISETADRDADDIIQDVALKIFSRNNHSPINNVAGFVYGAVKNKIIDIMRSKKQGLEIENESEEHLIEILDWLYSSADNLHSERMKHELKKALAELKPDYRNVILSIDFEQLTYRELSLESGISVGTLMSRRHRALAILNQKLGNKKSNK